MKRLTGTTLLGLTLLLTSAFAAPQQGGSITVSYKDDVTTLDPAVGYDYQNWPMEKMVFDALLDYTSGGTTLTPRLAAKMPDVSKDGKTYTFTLRTGVKFHNGRSMTADDVKYSLERVLDPRTKSPGQSFYTGIAGAQAFVNGKAKAVSGITVLAPDKVRITLDAPNAAFLNIMAMNFAFIVPKEAVAKAGADFGHQPVGTGPFTLEVVGQRAATRICPQPELLHQGDAAPRRCDGQGGPRPQRGLPQPPARRDRSAR